MSRDDFFDDVRAFLVRRTGCAPDAIRPATDLVAEGIVDSLLLMELFFFVEERLERPLETEGLQMDTFRTISGIHDRFVATAATAGGR